MDDLNAAWNVSSHVPRRVVYTRLGVWEGKKNTGGLASAKKYLIPSKSWASCQPERKAATAIWTKIISKKLTRHGLADVFFVSCNWGSLPTFLGSLVCLHSIHPNYRSSLTHPLPVGRRPAGWPPLEGHFACHTAPIKLYFNDDILHFWHAKKKTIAGDFCRVTFFADVWLNTWVRFRLESWL